MEVSIISRIFHFSFPSSFWKLNEFVSGVEVVISQLSLSSSFHEAPQHFATGHCFASIVCDERCCAPGYCTLCRSCFDSSTPSQNPDTEVDHFRIVRLSSLTVAPVLPIGHNLILEWDAAPALEFYCFFECIQIFSGVPLRCYGPPVLPLLNPLSRGGPESSLVPLGFASLHSLQLGSPS
jgi:hypothetical protein